MVATYRSSDSNPKERFVHQQAGAGGYGGSSYIDLVAFREKDANTAWTSASDGTLEERLYYCQNQHADVVALVTSAGGQREMDRYSAYGVPFGLPEGDSDSNGLADGTDRTIIQGWINTSAYDVRGDVDLDGDVDITDKNAVQALGAVTLGAGALSAIAVGSRRGHAAYAIDPVLAGSKYHIRNRVLDSELGNWMRRDMLGYIDSQSLYAYVASMPQNWQDPFGAKAYYPDHGGGTALGCKLTVHDSSSTQGGGSHFNQQEPIGDIATSGEANCEIGLVAMGDCENGDAFGPCNPNTKCNLSCTIVLNFMIKCPGGSWRYVSSLSSDHPSELHARLIFRVHGTIPQWNAKRKNWDFLPGTHPKWKGPGKLGLDGEPTGSSSGLQVTLGEQLNCLTSEEFEWEAEWSEGGKTKSISTYIRAICDCATGGG